MCHFSSVQSTTVLTAFPYSNSGGVLSQPNPPAQILLQSPDEEDRLLVETIGQINIIKNNVHFD